MGWEDEDTFTGEETKLVEFDSGDEGTSAHEQAYLIVLSGSRVGEMVKITDGLTIGRGPRAGLQTQDEGVSRSHVRVVEALDGTLFAEDLGSRNGTFVNGERINRKALKDGDKVQIGSGTILKLSYADKLEETFQRQMYNAALRDPLTGLYNRRHFDEQYLAEFSYAVRHLVPLAVIVLDLDHFKQVNDNYGHSVGDQVLTGLGSIIRQSTRKEDLLARYGGEEFVVLCRDTTSLKAFTVADRIRAAVEGATLVPERPELKITISAGLAGIPDPGLSSSAELFEAADKALYEAKSRGRNRVFLHDAEIDGSETPQAPPTSDTQKIR